MTAVTQYTVAALFIGALLGALVTYDPWLTAMLHLRVPLIVSIVILLAIISLGMVIHFGPRLYAQRDKIFIFLLILGLHVTAIQVGLDLGELCVALIAPLTLLEALSKNGRKFVITPFVLLAALFFLIILASLSKEFSPFAIKTEVKALVVFILLLTYLHWHVSPEWAMKVLIWISTVSCLLAIFQTSFWLLTGIKFVGVIDKQSLGEMYESTPFGIMFRSPGFTNGYRELSLVLGLSVALLASRLMDIEARNRRSTIFLLILHVVAIVLTITKDIMLGLVIAISLALILERPRRLLWIAAGGVLAIASFTAWVPHLSGGTLTVTEFIHELPRLQRERVQLNREGIEGYFRSGDYLLGAGIAGSDRFTDHYRNWETHNAFILVTAAAGLFGLVSYVSLYAWLAYRLWQIRFLARTRDDVILTRALGIFFVTQLVGTQFTSNFTELSFWLNAALIEATAIRLQSSKDISTSRTWTNRRSTASEHAG